MSHDEDVRCWSMSHDSGFSVKKIAKVLNKSERQIRYSLNIAGEEPPHKRLRIGRKRKINDEKILDVKLQKLTNETTVEAARSLSKDTGIQISASTLWRYRLDVGARKIKKKQRYLLLEADKQKRMEYCQKYLSDPLEDVWWSDAAWFGLSKKGHFIWWSARWGEPPDEIKFKLKPIFVWAAVSVQGTTELFEIPGNLNSFQYKELLKKVRPQILKYSPRGFRWVTDWWSVATANANKPYLKKYMHWIDGFPVKSGDLNLEEYIWAWLKGKMDKKSPVYQSDLYYFARDLWAELTPDLIRQFLKHLKDYMTAVVNHGGSYVNETFQRTLKRRKVVPVVSTSK